MKVSHFIGIGALCVGLYGCGGGDHGSTPMAPAPPASPPPPTSVMFSVNDVYSLTQSQSETDDPKEVNGGSGGSITGSDDTSDPMAVE
jgi:hypothetical protein